ncbi:MAG TPA: DUF6183 family protein [Actinomycetota bacterium]|nr:DUF6183 family protein [Actinomycetota bacterium]
MDASLAELIEAADLNALLRAVDGLCAARAWDDLVELADRCEEAVERGKQLWPIADHVDYRLALEAPGEYAGQVLVPAVGRFSHGPLTEVAASTHTWAELADHVDFPQAAAYTAQERVLRGEVLDGDERAHPEIVELPLHLEPWEPTYALARFGPTYVEVAEPWDPAAPLAEADVVAGEPLDDPDVTEVLVDLVQPWTHESNGAARAVVVEGDAVAAASHLTYGTLRVGPLRADEALQRMAWAAASGGAHGRRRGAALGRFLAWYAAAVLGALPWPSDPGALGAAVGELRWYRWDEGEPERGWVLRLAVEDRDHGWAAAVAATDLVADDDEESGGR